ncbi:uncharacterized protein LOC143028212 [Oratosquilla oratoria]|uniref:uncharacterized protein LOC143028212 n=1 Tax=Oratosquilla oratoria TaxID=337810 RepID=UPI003F760A86
MYLCFAVLSPALPRPTPVFLTCSSSSSSCSPSSSLDLDIYKFHGNSWTLSSRLFSLDPTVISSVKGTESMAALRSLVVAMAVMVVLLSAFAEASPYRPGRGGGHDRRCNPNFTIAVVFCSAGTRCFPRCYSKRDCLPSEVCCPDYITGNTHCTLPSTGLGR